MGQIEVYEYLKQQAKAGNRGWFTSRMVADALHGKCDVVRGDLVRLAISGYLDTQPARHFGEGLGWFRLKKKYVK